MESVEPLPQATVDDDRPISKPIVVKKLVPIRKQIVRPVSTRLPEIVRREATVTYGRRMLKGRLYPMVVRLGDAATRDDPPATREGTVTIQPIVPGAQVSPALADISTQSGSEARFSILPLCYGKLHDARIEIRIRGKTAATLALPTKVGRRRLAGFLLFLTVLLTGLLVWDRHIERLEPHVIEQLPPPPIPRMGEPDPPADGAPPVGGAPRGRVGGAVGGGGSMTLPPPPDFSRMPEAKYIPYRGEQAIDKWIEINERSSRKHFDQGSYEARDIFVLAVDGVHSLKFLGSVSNDGKDRSVLTWVYNGWEVLRNLGMSEVYLAAILLTLTIVVWFLQGPAQARRKSPAFELSIP